MFVNKLAITWSSIISFLSLAVSIILNHFEFGFLSNLCVGIFASALLALMIAIINYHSEKRKALYKLYCACMSFSQSFPFGVSIKSKDDLINILPYYANELNIYYNDIQFCFDELSVTRSKKAIKIISKLKPSISFIFDAITQIKSEIDLCNIGKQTFSELTSKELLINSHEIRKPLEDFTNTVNELHQYIADKKIHVWNISKQEEQTNAD